jgi:hypothetical protein
MKASLKWVLATGALAVAGSVAIAGTAMAAPGFGHHGGPFRMVMIDMLAGIDTNADSALSQDEINAAVNARYATFDANKDSQLSLEEFQALWTDLTRPVTVRAFQFLDSDGDAAVARSEVDKRFGSLVARLDRNNDGKLSQEDRLQRGHGGWHRWSDDEPKE